ncbi:hypothetical protein [Algoriphagus halophilus]|uniref:6-bladed beta-propeller protein n=1 Tax=Algoriphagus halophilus TaxID=226505 RepID=A0A1N6GZQ3_9BACT|nr:hypothetical protein [Algoriphagus halophilus]SIO13058.1 hypothetical protein SAMN05444394_3426 [Algoriphagus halophilus]
MKSLLKTSFYLLLLSAISCSEKSETIIEPTSYSLEILDSLDLAILGNPLIADVKSDGSKFLFYDFASSDLIVTNAEGEIQSKFSKKEDTPDAYGFMMEVPGFFGSNQIAIVGMKGIFLYDYEGNLIKKMDHPESLGGAGFMAFPGKHTESTEINGNDYLITKSVRSRDSFNGEMKFYNSFKALELINPESGSFTEMVPFEEGSMFLNGTGYYESDYAPAFETKDGKLYISLGAEQKLHVYNLSSEGASLDTAISFSIPGFETLVPKDLSEFSEGTVTISGSTPSIRNIHIIDNKILLHYYPGIDPEKMKEAELLWEQGKQEEAGELYEKLEAELDQGLLVIDQNSLKLEGIIPLPDNINKTGFTSANGFLWMEKAANEEQEEDFLRIYKVKILEK